MIDWESTKSELILNPSLLKKISLSPEQLYRQLPDLEAHIWIASSGTSRQHNDELKLIALSKEAILYSANAVNAHLESHSQDRWLHSLPHFHVGGMGILARSYLSKATLVPFYEENKKWNPLHFYDALKENQVTLCSLVPTQLYDLLQLELKAPSHLRVVLIGGAALSSQLYQQAKKFMWPLLPSYGMSECCSQIATAELSSLQESFFPRLKILPHLKVKINPNKRLMVSGKSLLSLYAFLNRGDIRWHDPKNDGWLTTEDVVQIEGGYLSFQGRIGDQIKILGELVSLPQLRNQLEKIAQSFDIDAALLALPDERKGNRIVLLIKKTCDEALSKKILTLFNNGVLPFEKASQIYELDSIPRSSLGKFLAHEALIILKEKYDLNEG